MTSLTKSQIFITYNLARAAANRGDLDRARVNSALGLLQRKDGGARPYQTTTQACNCPDSTIRKQVCKHRISKMIEVRIQEAV